MPTYQYACSACNHEFEILQSMTDRKLRKCPKCGKPKLHRLIGSGGGIIFKGTGFYETDFKTKDKPKEEAKPVEKKVGDTKAEKTGEESASKSNSAVKAE